ncbi:MAG: DUF4292 domain-containing protein [Myxococcales bacterium]|nr:DUF4292 domain-containing protein [Myxococcales bacterium]
MRLVWFLSLALCACGGVPRPRYAHSDPLALLVQHREARSQVMAIRAEAKVDQRAERGRIKGRVLMFVQRPGRLRFDAMTQFGPVAILTSDATHFAYSDLREKRFLHGATCRKNIARMLGVPLSVQEATELLLGGSAAMEHARAELRWHDEGFYRVELLAKDGRSQQIDLGVHDADLELPADRQRLRLLASRVRDARGTTIWSARYDDYRMLEGEVAVEMPFEVQIEQPGRGSDTLIRFKEVALDADVPDAAFTQQAAPGMVVEEAACD